MLYMCTLSSSSIGMQWCACVQKRLARDGYATDSDPDDETHWPYRRERPPRRQHRRLPRQAPVDWLFAAPSAAPSAGGRSTADLISGAQPAARWSSAAAVSAADPRPEQLRAGVTLSGLEEVTAVAASEISDLLCCPITHVSSLDAGCHELSMLLCLPHLLLLLLLVSGPIPHPACSACALGLCASSREAVHLLMGRSSSARRWRCGTL